MGGTSLDVTFTIRFWWIATSLYGDAWNAAVFHSTSPRRHAHCCACIDFMVTWHKRGARKCLGGNPWMVQRIADQSVAPCGGHGKSLKDKASMTSVEDRYLHPLWCLNLLEFGQFLGPTKTEPKICLQSLLSGLDPASNRGCMKLYEATSTMSAVETCSSRAGMHRTCLNWKLSCDNKAGCWLLLAGCCLQVAGCGLPCWLLCWLLVVSTGCCCSCHYCCRLATTLVELFYLQESYCCCLSITTRVTTSSFL